MSWVISASDFVRMHSSRNGGMTFEMFRGHTYNQSTTHKPDGLWYSVGGEWLEWLEENKEYLHEDFAGGSDHDYLLDIDESRLLIIRTQDELEGFGEEYAQDESGFFMINWSRVEDDYAGIEIPNLLGYHTHATNWYYGWDVSSGCLWDMSALRGVEEIVGPTPS